MFKTNTNGFDKQFAKVSEIVGECFRSSELSSIAQEYCEKYGEELTDRFEQQGPGWQELKKSTVKAKISKGYSDPERILYATGNLAASMETGADGNVRDVGTNTITYGTSVPSAQYHHPDAQERDVIALPSNQLIEKTGEKINKSLVDAAG